MASLILPKHVPLHRNVIGTQKGAWLVRVESVVAADETQRIAVHLALERVSEEVCVTRRLYTICTERDLHVPQQRVLIADHIRRWLEKNEGNGVLNFEAEAAHAA